MPKLILVLLTSITMQMQIIFNFSQDSDSSQWYIINDDVMGGRSSANFTINEEGHGVFKGQISLENNGGFSSLRHRFKRINTTPYSKVLVRLKGDGKSYQFRVKTKASDYYSYVKTFGTSNEWETIEIKLSEMQPIFRGRSLNIGNYDSDSIEEITFLIGNKKAESFELIIDCVSLK